MNSNAQQNTFTLEANTKNPDWIAPNGKQSDLSPFFHQSTHADERAEDNCRE